MSIKIEILSAALEGRKAEVLEYQINLDNYRLAIAKIGDDEELAPFKAQLEELLHANRLEQRKAQIMLEVLAEQLAAEAGEMIHVG